MAAPAIPAPVLESLREPILDILRRSDLSSISAKKVRNALTQLPDPRVPERTLLQGLLIKIHDKPSKSLVDDLIRECFDIVSREAPASAAVPAGNGHAQSNGYAAPAAAVPRIALPGLGGIPGSLAQPPPPSSGTSTTTAAPPSSSTSSKRSRKQEDVISDEEVDIDVNAAKRTSSGKKVIKKRKSDNGEPKAPNPNNPFNKPVILDDALSRVCGGKEMPRYMITKQLWVYIKERDLQNPSNKREIICDSALSSLFGKERVDSFEMAKLVSQHVTKKEA